MNKTLISIIIPLYNREKLIVKTLKSILAQTYTNWECIVVDDGSTDNSWGVLQDYAKRDRRIKPIQRKQEPKGAPTCRNIGMEQAKGEYLIFLDSDDLLAPWCIESRINILNETANLEVLLSNGLQFNAVNKVFYDFVGFYGTKNVLESFLSFEVVYQTTAPTWKTSFLRENNITWNPFSAPWDDVDFSINALSKKPIIKWNNVLPDYFVRKEDDPNALTSINNIVEKVVSNFKTYEHWLNNEHHKPIMVKNFPDYMLSKLEFLLPPKDLNYFIHSHPDLILKHLGKGSLSYLKLYNKTRDIPLLKGVIYRLRPFLTGIKRRPVRKKDIILTAEMKKEIIEKLNNFHYNIFEK